MKHKHAHEETYVVHIIFHLLMPRVIQDIVGLNPRAHKAQRASEVLAPPMITIGPEPHATHQAQSDIRSSPEARASTTNGQRPENPPATPQTMRTTDTMAKQGTNQPQSTAMQSDSNRHESQQGGLRQPRTPRHTKRRQSTTEAGSRNAPGTSSARADTTGRNNSLTTRRIGVHRLRRGA